MPTRVLLVCLGNICRSPTAEAVLRQLVAEAGLSDEIEVDSAGTGGWHIGDPADPRARAAGRRRGYELTGTARQINTADFDEFDLILGLDSQNVRELRRLAPAAAHERVRRLGPADVPDPYYGDDDGFDEVIDIVEAACRTLLDELRFGQ